MVKRIEERGCIAKVYPITEWTITIPSRLGRIRIRPVTTYRLSGGKTEGAQAEDAQSRESHRKDKQEACGTPCDTCEPSRDARSDFVKPTTNSGLSFDATDDKIKALKDRMARLEKFCLAINTRISSIKEKAGRFFNDIAK